MVFSSFPVYLDHSNLHQLQQSYHQQGTGLENPQIAVPGAPVGGGPGSIRSGSMVDRARIARIPLPENGLKCPRCDSTSTKFCYFNNYSLTQPRHFCKTCRRYWTRGGALRNVPVGGGCRKNKRSKNGGSKAAVTSEKQSGGGGSGNNTSNNDACPNNNFLPAEPCIEYQAGLSHYGGGGGSSTNTNIGSSIGGFIQAPQLVATNENNGGFGEMSFQLGNNNNNNFLSAEPWRLPASLAGFEPPSTNLLFPFQNEGIEASSSQQVKMEDSRNSTKQFLGAVGNNNQFWGGTWIGGFSGHLNSSSTSSSTTHLL